jgi:hypothetical protein
MATATDIIDRGLVLTRPDELAPEELQEFKDHYIASKGSWLPAFEFWIQHRPDVLKRYRLQARQSTTPTTLPKALPNVLAFLHYYSIVGYPDGILYEINLARDNGARKNTCLATIAVAFIHGGPRGMRYVSTSSNDAIRDFQEPEKPENWPDGWAPDPEAFQAGLDFSSGELLPGELEKVVAWYERVSGEVPAWVHFLAKHRPHALKAMRNRFEFAIKDAMPKQMMPYLQLHWNTARCHRDGIREAALMGRGFGMTDELIADAIVWGTIYGGPSSMSAASEATADII